MIEMNQPVTGVRRITVLVTLMDYSISASTGYDHSPRLPLPFK